MSARFSWVHAALLALSSVGALGMPGMSGCAPDDNPPNLVKQPPPVTDPCADFKCVVTSPGCAASRITASDATSTCATCVLDGNDVDVCGNNEVARCEARETTSGTACHLCVVDATGEILKETGKMIFVRGLLRQGDHLVCSFTGTMRKVPRPPRAG